MLPFIFQRDSVRERKCFFMRKNKTDPMKYLMEICLLAILCAMQIVFARFLVIPIGTSMRFSLSFIPVVIAARRYGIRGGVTVYGLGDLLGAIIFPTGGAFQVGFTVTAVVSGFIFGLFLGEKSPFRTKLNLHETVRIVASVLLSQVVCSLLLNSFWLSFYYGIPFAANIATRIPQILIIGTLQIIFMIIFLERIYRAFRRSGV